MIFIFYQITLFEQLFLKTPKSLLKMLKQTATAILMYVPLPKLNNMTKKLHITPCGTVYEMSAVIGMIKRI